jgi:hypothetical protein
MIVIKIHFGLFRKVRERESVRENQKIDSGEGIEILFIAQLAINDIANPKTGIGNFSLSLSQFILLPHSLTRLLTHSLTYLLTPNSMWMQKANIFLEDYNVKIPKILDDAFKATLGLFKLSQEEEEEGKRQREEKKFNWKLVLLLMLLICTKHEYFLCLFRSSSSEEDYKKHSDGTAVIFSPSLILNKEWGIQVHSSNCLLLW